jgi:hypothetical protein
LINSKGNINMKITFDLEDFWMEAEEGTLEENLKDHITNSVVHEVRKSIQEQVDTEITKGVTSHIEGVLSEIIQGQIAKCIDTGFITRHREEVKITDHVSEMFNNHSSWGNPDKKLEQLAKSFAEDFKAQYNNVFASKIVQNMKEQGLLKDEVVQILLKEQ